MVVVVVVVAEVAADLHGRFLFRGGGSSGSTRAEVELQGSLLIFVGGLRGSSAKIQTSSSSRLRKLMRIRG